MNRKLKMPWSMEDTTENMKRIRDMMIKKVRQVNYDGKAEEDVREINFDFNRTITALEEIQQYRAIGTVEEITKNNDFFNTQTAKTLAKLQEYEKTGLTPQEIMDGKLLTGWIPVEERLPEDSKYILLSFSNFSLPMVGRYEKDEEGGAFYLGDCDEEDTCAANDLFVNAWMPLPEPYRPEAEAKLTEMEGGHE